MIFRDAAKALEFYTTVLGAEELTCHRDDAGIVRHAEFRIGNTTFMMTNETPSFPGMRGAESFGGSPIHLFVYLPEVDTLFKKALTSGASLVMPLAEQSYGRSGGFKDPFGITWWLSTHREDAR